MKTAIVTDKAPARVEVAGLPKGALIESERIACLD